jgi:DNA-directed RNA polymerase specialized sigma24 family protein
MTPRPLEQCFARFRDAHDLDALAEVFDRTAPRLLDVARHLARGRGEAEDLVQATFLAALEHPERFDEGRELVPWLLGILANHVKRAAERRRAAGAPLAGHALAATSGTAEEYTHTDAEGRFALTVPKGSRWTLEVRGPPQGAAFEEVLLRRADVAPGEVELRLERVSR